MSVGDSKLRDRLAVDFVRWLPKGTLGHVVGFLSRRNVPRPLRGAVYRQFARHYGIDLDQVEHPLESYRNFASFFGRGLRSGARAIDPSPDVAVSPVDGTVVEAGVITAGRLLQAKGVDYTLRGLLIDERSVATFEEGSYATFYLAPRDYHRIHAPAAGRVVAYQHVPGAFFPVGPRAVRHVAGLFARNERLVTYLDTPLGQVAVVKVAAVGVGHISVSYDRGVRTRHRGALGRIEYPEGIPIAKGAELGAFHLGSTVIVLFERGRVALDALAPGDRVLVGQAIARRAGDALRGAVA